VASKRRIPHVVLRQLYLVQWYDTEGDSGWGKGAKQPPLVCQPCFILEWPRKKQRVSCYRVATAWCEGEPGGTSVIPAACVRGVPEPIGRVAVEYRDKRDA